MNEPKISKKRKVTFKSIKRLSSVREPDKKSIGRVFFPSRHGRHFQKFDTHERNSKKNSQSNENTTKNNEDDEFTEEMGFDFNFSQENNQNTYFERQKKESKHWKESENLFFNAFITNQVFPQDACCVICNQAALYRCLDCGPNIFLCKSCTEQIHNKTNLFHRQSSKEHPYRLIPMIILLPKMCSEIICHHERKKILAVQLKGQFQVEVPLCNNIIATLLHHKLFPATPVMPQVAFSFELLDFYHEFMMEAHVTHLAFCRILERLHCPQFIHKNIYLLFLNAVQQYQGLKNRVDNYLHDLHNDQLNKFKCPACPQPHESDAKVTIAFDANFQLTRYKSAGKDFSSQLINNQFLKPHNEYVEFERSKASTNSSKKLLNQLNGCDSHFKASEQKTKKNDKWDDSGLFGCTCRHGIPIRFINLRDMTERYNLTECLLEEIIKKYPFQTQTFNVMYDIACNFHNHVKKPSSPIFPYLNRIDFAVSIFHAYAHTPSCQVMYHPRRMNNFGLTDGESLERLWSYLGRFVSMTRRMRPNHRLDILALAIEHYATKGIENLGIHLVKRMKMAQKMESSCFSVLNTLYEKYNFNEDIILNAIEIQKRRINKTETSFLQQIQGYEQYYEYLADLVLFGSNKSLEKKAQKYEKSLNIKKRWDPLSEEYTLFSNSYAIRKIEYEKNLLLSNSIKYNFLKVSLNNQGHIGIHLVKRMKMAQKMESSCFSVLNTLYEKYNFNEDIILNAIEIQKRRINKTETSFLQQIQGYEQYYEYLADLVLFGSNKSLEKKAQKYEKSLNIKKRWDPLSEEYTLFSNSYAIRKIEYEKNLLLSNSIKYNFLKVSLNNQGHIGNNSTVSKIKALSAIKNRIQISIKKYNKYHELMQIQEKTKYPEARFEDISETTSDFWKSLDNTLENSTGVPQTILYDSIIEYCNMKRAHEEMNTLPQEMIRLVKHWKSSFKSIDTAIEKLLDTTPNQQELGTIIHLKQIQNRTFYRLNDCITRFNFFLNNHEIYSSEWNVISSLDEYKLPINSLIAHSSFNDVYRNDNFSLKSTSTYSQLPEPIELNTEKLVFLSITDDSIELTNSTVEKIADLEESYNGDDDDITIDGDSDSDLATIEDSE
ncbi:hypothetical protein Glove_24g30 [Diversispora epigaea]|uniref:CxC2-like cysteine cluster KDZ transposase-associated domain-containing protein n=1 Tax=Diversispora epigaea TaxID=1348612 RepID=A0A397JKW8_9GLOM|nr:hypothetical protein Glove_24g30 [Diversispora epigaea]